MRRARAALFAALLLAGCGRSSAPEPGASSAKPAAALPQKVEIVVPPNEGPIAVAVESLGAKARVADRQLLVYVGAHWCEPCNRFLGAVRAGQLDAVYPKLTLVVYDLDKDRARLEAAGYKSEMIPLFAVPKKDGTASGLQMEGSIKGEGAVDEIRPRLDAMLAQAKRGT